MGTLTSISEMWECGELCDIVIVVDKQKFPVHKLVLAASSAFFHAMFMSDFQEKDKSEIQLVGQSAASFKDYLYYIYNEHVDLTLETVESVYAISMYLQAVALTEFCAEYMFRNIDVDTCIRYVILSNQDNKSEFYEKAVATIAKNFSQLCEDPSFYHLDSSVIKDVLQQEDFADVSEEFVLKIVLKWLDMNEADSVLACEILEHVRWGLFASSHLQTMLQQNSYIRNETCQKMVQKAVDYLQNERLQPLKGGIFSTPRGLPALGVFGGLCQNSLVHCFVGLAHESELAKSGTKPYLSRKHNNVACMPVPVCYSECASSVVINNILFLVGGCLENWRQDRIFSLFSSCSYVLKYNPLLNSWTMMAPLTNPRFGHATVAIEYPDGNPRIMVIGGCARFVGDIATTEVYDILTDTWTEQDSFPHQVFAPAACVFEGFVYVSGGKLEYATSSKSMYRFRPKSHEWEFVSNMLMARSHHAMGVVNKSIFIVGSENTTDDLILYNAEIYDPHLDQMTKVNWTWLYYNLSGAVFLKDRVYRINRKSVQMDSSHNKSEHLAIDHCEFSYRVFGEETMPWDSSLALLHLPHQVPSENSHS